MQLSASKSTGTTTLVNKICKALCDWQDYVWKGYEFTSSQVKNTLEKDSASFLHSKNIDRWSNELSIELSINEVCSNPLPELKNLKLENANNFW